MHLPLTCLRFCWEPFGFCFVPVKEVSVAKKPRRNNSPKPVDRRRDLHRGQQQLECRCFIFMPVSNKYQLGSALALKFLFAELPNEQFQLYFLACLSPFYIFLSLCAAPSCSRQEAGETSPGDTGRVGQGFNLKAVAVLIRGSSCSLLSATAKRSGGRPKDNEKRVSNLD